MKARGHPDCHDAKAVQYYLRYRRRKELAEHPEIVEEATIGNWDITPEE